ncbi:MAG TPA: NAD-dependent epimerase/dehydratase family protein [Thermodesulfobacteriota bacterium]|nr:NAD-dependent epimerase/dehydratase family protein [Thermodesulfobacteriota bacterium]
MRVGIIGCGQIANIHIPVIKKYPNVEIVGLADVNVEVLENTASKFHISDRFTNPPDLIEKKKRPEVVHILTPPQYHYELAKMALEGGCHVYVEKPMCMNAAEGEKLVKLAKQKNLKLCVGHNHLFDSVMVEARKLAERGDVGTICSIECCYGSDLGSDSKGRYFTQAYRHWVYQLPGGIFQNLLDHPLSVIIPFIGNPTSVYSLSAEAGVVPPGIPSELQVILGDGRITAHINLSLAASPRFYHLTLYGTNGNISVDFFNKRIIQRSHGKMPRAVSRALFNLKEGSQILTSTLSNTGKVLTGRFFPYEGLERLVTEFYKSIETGIPSPVPPESGLTALRIMDTVWKQIDYPRDNAALMKKYRVQPDSSAKVKILITGASGFVGANLLKKLSENDNYYIRAMVRNPRKIEGLVKDRPIDIFIGDLSDEKSVFSAVEGIDVIYHIAATMGGKWSDYVEGTIKGTERLVQAALQHRIKKFVYISSIAVYGIPENGNRPIMEDSPYTSNHLNNYIKSKIEAERIILENVKNNQLPATILRAGVIYGPGRVNQLPRIGYQLVGKFFVKIGLNSVTLPVVYIDNVVDALILAGNSENSVGQVYNVVDDERFTQMEYLSKLNEYGKERIYYISFPYTLASGVGSIAGKLSKYSPHLERISSYLSPFHLQSCAKELDYDNSKIKRELGWKPDSDIDKHFRRIFG